MKQKLNEAKVKLILELVNETDATDSQIGSVFNVSRETICSIRNGHRWSRVSEIEPKTSNQFRDFTPNLNNPVELRRFIINTVKNTIDDLL